MKKALLRQAPRFVAMSQRQSAQALRLYASTAPSPSVDEIQFQVVSAEGAEYASRPFPTLTKAQLEEGIQQKAAQTRNQWEARFADTPEGALFKDVLQLKPYDEKALNEELTHVTQPKIQATVDEAVDTKNHNFLTDLLASRTASYLEDPTLYFSYGENPSAALSANWSATLQRNLTTLNRRELVDRLADLAAELKEFRDFESQGKKSTADAIQKLQANAEYLGNRQRVHEHLSQTVLGVTPAQLAYMTDLETVNPLSHVILPVTQRHAAEWEQYRKESPIYSQLNELSSVARELVKQLQASGLQFDASKVSF